MSNADKLKEHGNACFAKGKLEAAIEAYSGCICLEPSVAVYYTNRALCHHKKEQWQLVVTDCTSALALDGLSVKAHYLLGAALVELSSYTDGIEALNRALQLCKERTVSYKEDIQRALLSARKRHWEVGRDAANAQLAASEQLVVSLLQKHFAQAGADATARPHVEACVGEALALLRERATPSQVPDHFCCKISMEVMLDPVTTPCGVTYERSSLRAHLASLRQKGEPGFDPISRKPLQMEQAVPNLALREAIDGYLRERPWAYESTL